MHAVHCISRFLLHRFISRAGELPPDRNKRSQLVDLAQCIELSCTLALCTLWVPWLIFSWDRVHQSAAKDVAFQIPASTSNLTTVRTHVGLRVEESSARAQVRAWLMFHCISNMLEVGNLGQP
jgi:hypothetical protein